MSSKEYVCSGCNQKFTNVVAFLTHICKKSRVQGSLVLRSLQAGVRFFHCVVDPRL